MSGIGSFSWPYAILLLANSGHILDWFCLTILNFKVSQAEKHAEKKIWRITQQEGSKNEVNLLNPSIKKIIIQISTEKNV